MANEPKPQSPAAEIFTRLGKLETGMAVLLERVPEKLPERLRLLEKAEEDRKNEEATRKNNTFALWLTAIGAALAGGVSLITSWFGGHR